MYYDKDDIPILVIVFAFLFFLLYTNYQHNQRVEEKLKEVADYNYSVILRQVHMSEQIDKISVDIDSIRALYLHK